MVTYKPTRKRSALFLAGFFALLAGCEKPVPVTTIRYQQVLNFAAFDPDPAATPHNVYSGGYALYKVLIVDNSSPPSDFNFKVKKLYGQSTLDSGWGVPWESYLTFATWRAKDTTIKGGNTAGQLGCVVIPTDEFMKNGFQPLHYNSDAGEHVLPVQNDEVPIPPNTVAVAYKPTLENACAAALTCTTPFDPARVAAGQVLYQNNCQKSCHDNICPQVHGAPPFTPGQSAQLEGADVGLLKKLKDAVVLMKESCMTPPYQKALFNPISYEQLKDLAAYLAHNDPTCYAIKGKAAPKTDILVTSDFIPLSQTTTTYDGTYTVAFLSSGNYKVKAVPQDKNVKFSKDEHALVLSGVMTVDSVPINVQPFVVNVKTAPVDFK